eukprot:PhM_4_TR3451/c5_g1_i1/m.73695
MKKSLCQILLRYLQRGKSTSVPSSAGAKKETATIKAKKVMSTTSTTTTTDADDATLAAALIPRNLSITKEQMAQRKYLNLERWHCMSRPQYKASCGVSSLTSAWNYLYSTLGTGTLPPISQEEVMADIIGVQPPFQDVKWGPFTGNAALMRWFHMINRKYGVEGKAHYFYKVHGQGRTIGLDGDEALTRLKTGLRSPDMAFVYHCYNHYFCPIGYEDQVPSPVQAYAPLGPRESPLHTHLIIGEVSRGNDPLLFRKWSDVVTDLGTALPEYYNIRHPERGVMRKEKSNSRGNNIHCIMCFRKDLVEKVDWVAFDEAERAEEAENEKEDDDEPDTSATEAGS